jgi:SAM-dependent methyltransferase
MRHKSGTSNFLRAGSKASIGVNDDVPEEAYDEKAFFDSFYTSTVRGEITDRDTIGAITEPESRFHYNVLENSIIRAIVCLEQLPHYPMIQAWRFSRRRSGLRHLDVGSGTGHWIDFFRDVFLVSESVCLEISDAMVEYLGGKYNDTPDVRILQCDIGSKDLDISEFGEPYDYISAIGVMFHIVDDGKWRRALKFLGSQLKLGGILLVGGEFGTRTENVQFHKTDHFSSWREHAVTEAGATVRINKRIRSLATWSETAHICGLEVQDVIRSDRALNIMTPENDLLVLSRK